ncbi:IS21 family transposase, partial [Myxococcota bacterium]
CSDGLPSTSTFMEVNPMPSRLRKEEIVTISVLAEKGETKSAIARVLGVCEGTVRYHLKRLTEGKRDGRQDKPRKAEAVRDEIAHWYEARKDDPRPVNVLDLYEWLVAEHHYEGSYKSVLRFVRAEYPKPRIRTYRRVETPPGAQSQTDWVEYPRVVLGGSVVPLHAFIMTLSFCRKPAIVWQRSEDQLAWLDSHNQSYRQLQGVAAVNRIDNVKTAIASGAGCWGEINQTYRSYANTVGFHIDACQPRAANAKGKVEAKARLSRLHINPVGRYFEDLEHLQYWSDAEVDCWAEKAICPATGDTVQQSWEYELDFLQALPVLPEPFDIAVTRPVHKDCMVHFEGRSYAVPFIYAMQTVEVRGCAGKVQILADSNVVREYPRHTAERVLIDPSCYEGEATDRVLPPPPLGRMGKRLQEIMDTPVESRPIDLYAALAEVAR